MSKVISLTPAWLSLSIRAACSCRGHGQTPISRIEGESIATSTMSPPAWRGNVRNRRSVSKSCRMPRSPVRSASTSTHATRICGRYRFTLAPRGRFLCAVRPSRTPRPTATWRFPLLLSRRLPEFPSLPPPGDRNGHGDDAPDHEREGERQRIGISLDAQSPLTERSQAGTPSVSLGGVPLRQCDRFNLAKERRACQALSCCRGCGRRGKW